MAITDRSAYFHRCKKREDRYQSSLILNSFSASYEYVMNQTPAAGAVTVKYTVVANGAPAVFQLP